MALKVQIDNNQLKSEQEKIRRKIENDIIRILKFAGEKFVRDARSMSREEGGFGDVTGNLRASIGYFIVKGDEIIFTSFDKEQQIAKQAAAVVLTSIDQSESFQLIGLAGMQYASAVESRGLNVISVQAEAAIVDLEKYFKEVERKYRS